MSLNNIDLTPYELTAIHHSDNFLIHYNAVDDDGKSYIITEFFPAYMVDRLEWGEIEASARFADEYSKAKQLFLDKALAMKQMTDISIPRIENVVERNNTAYIIRKVINYPTLDDYMGTNCMPYEDAYIFIRPLLLTLVQAEQNGLIFVFDDGDMRVNRYGQLLIDAVFNWEASYTATITLLAKLFYRLVNGHAHDAVPAEEEPRRGLGMDLDMDEGGELDDLEAAPVKPKSLMPSRLDAMIKEILNGGMLYGALEDFNKNFKFIMDVQRSKSSSHSGEKDPMLFMRIMRWVVVALSTALIGAVVLLITGVIIPVYRATHPDLTDPALIHTPAPVRTVAPQLRNYSGFSATSPVDNTEILNGLCYEKDGVMYYRAYNGDYFLAKRGPDGVEQVLLLDVRPTFITVYDNRVYFSDGLTDYRLMRVDTDGKNPYILTDESAMFPFMQGEWLYYTNHDDLDRLYRMNPVTGEAAPYIKQAAYETVSFGNRLYFLNGDNRYHLYAAEHGEPPQWQAVNEMSSDNLRVNGQRLYFIDVADGEIYSVGTDGHITAAGWPAAYMFDITDKWLVMIEKETNRLRAFNRTTTGEEVPLPYQQAAYVKIVGDTMVYVDYDDSKVVSRIQLP